MIVTSNLKDFPAGELAKLNLEAKSPDEYQGKGVVPREALTASGACYEDGPAGRMFMGGTLSPRAVPLHEATGSGIILV